MEIKLNVLVECKDGRCGRATRLIINPVDQNVTHLVVRDHEYPHTERLLPTVWIVNSNHDGIQLSCTYEEWLDMEDFYSQEFIPTGNDPDNDDSKHLSWPYVTTLLQNRKMAHRNIPVHSFELRRGTKVEAKDGRIGHIDELLVGPYNKRITHIVITKGYFWHERDIVIPIDAIAKITDDCIKLNITKADVDELPTVPIHRHFTPEMSGRWPKSYLN